MNQLILFVDIETLLVDALTGRPDLAGYAIASRLPTGNTARRRSIVLTRVGGIRKTLVSDEPTVTVDVRAPTEAEAGRIAQLLRALIHQMDGETMGGCQVHSVGEVSGVNNLPDPTTPELARYTQTFAIHVSAVR